VLRRLFGLIIASTLPGFRQPSPPLHPLSERREVEVKKEIDSETGYEASGNDACFLEAKISLPIIYWVTDDYVVQHLDLENPGCFAESTSEAKIGFAWAGVSGYAACGITGVIPHPVLCRMVTGFSKSGQRPDAA